MNLDKSKPLLQNHELFSRLSDKVLQSIMDKIVFEKIKTDTVIFKEGDPGDRLYLIVEGHIRISVESKEGQQVELAVLKDGDYFGEMAILTHTDRSATATTLTPCLLYYLDKTDFRALIEQHTEIALELSHVLSQRLSYTNQLLLRERNQCKPALTSLQEMPDEMMTAFQAQMNQQQVHRGEIIFAEGDIGDKLYLIERGEVAIIVSGQDGQEIRLATLKPGDYFGEMAMLTDALRTATARAVTDSLLLYLHKEDFNRLIQNHQVVALELSKVLSQRLSKTNTIITQKETNTVVLLLANKDEKKHIDHFISYLSTLTSKPIKTYTNLNKTQLISKLKVQERSVLVVWQSNFDESILSYSDYIVNFHQKKPEQLFIGDTFRKQDIERTARLIARKRIGIALSSGTAPGLAHIGVLKVLQEAGIPIDYIAGTSGGSLYGAPYAFGYSYDQIYETFSKVYKKSLYRLYDPAMSKSGIFGGKKLLTRTIRKLIGDENIENSRIPYAAVATDLITGREEIFTSGNLIRAIRASLSIPIIFTPVPDQNKLLVDGVVTTPIPVSALEKAHIDIKLAVYVSELTPFASNKKPNMLQVFLRARNISADFIADESAERADVLIKPCIPDLKQFDYHRIDEVIKEGERCAQQVIPRIQRLMAK